MLRFYLAVALFIIGCSCAEKYYPDWERERWLKHMNIRIGKAARSVIDDDVFSKASIEKYLELMTDHLHLDGTEFYREEFNYCDHNRDEILQRSEVLLCNSWAEARIMDHFKSTMDKPYDYLPAMTGDHIFAINMTRLQVKTQKETGLDFEAFYKLKIFVAMVYGRALYFQHDNYGDRRNHYICSAEWEDVASAMVSIFPGYTKEMAWEDFKDYDMNRSLAMEEYELYFYFDGVWKRWFLRYI